MAKCEGVDGAACTGLEYFATDHLGSTVMVMDANGDLLSEQRYLPFVGVREIDGLTAMMIWGGAKLMADKTEE